MNGERLRIPSNDEGLSLEHGRAGRITKQLRKLRRRLDAFVKRRRVVLELKLPPTIGFELIGVEDGFQDFDDESKALLFCLLTIVWFRLAALALKSRPRLLWNAT